MKKGLFAAAIVALIATASQAGEFQPVGNGSVGLGGAGVARNYGAFAPYWNPAGLAFAKKTVSVGTSAQVGVQPGGTLSEALDGLEDLDLTPATDAEALPTRDEVINRLGMLENGFLRATAGGGLGVQIKRFGFGVFGSFEAAATAVADTTNVNFPTTATPSPANPFSTDGPLTVHNTSTVTIDGFALIEVPLSYGHELDLKEYGMLGLGMSAKYLQGEATTSTKRIFTTDGTDIDALSSDDLTDDLSDNRTSSSSFGIDLGTMWKPKSPLPLTLAVVGKNLNAPTFKTVAGGKIKIDRQVRAGFSAELLPWLELSADVDVLSNRTLISGLKSQVLGGGAELHPFDCLKLRVGGYKNLASSADGAVTAGLSLGIPWLYLDVDGAYGLGTVKYDGSSYPSEAKVQVGLNVMF